MIATIIAIIIIIIIIIINPSVSPPLTVRLLVVHNTAGAAQADRRAHALALAAVAAANV